MTKAVVKAESKELSIGSEELSSWGASSNLESSDFRVSRILLMQGTSDMVKDRSHEAKIGEFRDNVTGSLIGSMDHPVNFIPFHLEKRWDVEVFNKETMKFKWDRSDLVTPENSNREISRSKKKFTPNSKGECFFVSYRAYVLLETDLAKDVLRPYVIDFKASSRETGRQLGQRMYQENRIEKLPPAAYVATLSAEEISNDENTWLAFTVKGNTRLASQAELLAAFKMFKMLNDMDTRNVDKEDASGVADDIGF